MGSASHSKQSAHSRSTYSKKSFLGMLGKHPVLVGILVFVQLLVIISVFAVVFSTLNGVFASLSAMGMNESTEQQILESFGLLQSVIVGAVWQLGLMLILIFCIGEGVLIVLSRKVLGTSSSLIGFLQYFMIFLAGVLIIGLGVSYFFSITLSETDTSLATIVIIVLGFFVLFLAEVLGFQDSWHRFGNVLLQVGLRRMYLLLLLFIGVSVLSLALFALLSYLINYNFVVVVFGTFFVVVMLVLIRLISIGLVERWVKKYV